MDRAVELAATARFTSSPNPWVGALVVVGGDSYEGRTNPPGGLHAEREALDRAGDAAHGATLYTTLEPCSHQGRTGPCTDAVIAAGVSRVVVGIEDPDPEVDGRGIAALRSAGIEVVVGVRAGVVERQLAAYLVHRRTGRPYVVAKLAATLDGRIAAPDGSSRWITGPEARADAHRLRAESDAVLVGAGTVRADDPSLTVRDADLPTGVALADVQPRRVVLGRAPDPSRVRPALEMSGDLAEVLDELGRQGVVQLLVEGGSSVSGAFHRAGLVDRYVVYLAPAFSGGDDAKAMFGGAGAATVDDLWRGRVVDVRRLGDDLRLDIE